MIYQLIITEVIEEFVRSSKFLIRQLQKNDKVKFLALQEVVIDGNDK